MGSSVRDEDPDGPDFLVEPRADSAGQRLRGPPNREAPEICETFHCTGGLLRITNNATYRLRRDDEWSKCFDYGVTSEFLCQTLLQAKAMFRPTFLAIDVALALKLSYDAFCDLVAMDEMIEEFKSAENAALRRYEEAGSPTASMDLPVLGCVEESGTAFIEKAAHFTESLFEIMRLFYPQLAAEHPSPERRHPRQAKQRGWLALRLFLKTTYGEHDFLYETVRQATPRMLLIRDARDGLVHGRPWIKTSDFRRHRNGSITPPAIEIKFRTSRLDRRAVRRFMEQITSDLADSFQLMVVHACRKNTFDLPIRVGRLTEDEQKTRHVRFVYGHYRPDGRFVAVDTV
jgi:hypothetical protein